jgi:hypothetical protein
VKNIDLAVLAAVQPGRDGISPLSATPLGTGGVCLPASWRTAAASIKRPRLGGRAATGFAPVMTLTDVTKPGHTNIRNQHTNMTRVYADGEGGSGPQPLSKPA